jgi:hypothetical protein
MRVLVLPLILSIVAANAPFESRRGDEAIQVVDIVAQGVVADLVGGTLHATLSSAGHIVQEVLTLTTTVVGDVGGKAKGAPPAPKGKGKGAGDCPVLNLQLGAISLNVLGLDIETSKICLAVHADASQGLVGELLCELANAVQLGNLVGFLNGLHGDLQLLLSTLTQLLNGALGPITSTGLPGLAIASLPVRRQSCSILHLSLGPITLNILGLEVDLDNCNDGPVTVDINGQTGALVGDLLCSLDSLNLNLDQITNLLGGLANVLSVPEQLLALLNGLPGLLAHPLSAADLPALAALLDLAGLRRSSPQYHVVGGALLGFPLGLGSATLFVLKCKRKERNVYNEVAHENVQDPQIPVVEA